MLHARCPKATRMMKVNAGTVEAAGAELSDITFLLKIQARHFPRTLAVIILSACLLISMLYCAISEGVSIK